MSIATIIWAGASLLWAAPLPEAPPVVVAPVQAVAPASAETRKLPAPIEEVLTTHDGVQLVVTFLPGSKGKDSVPIILLHMYKGGRKDFRDLALYLQSLGHAVLIPDLRGHGASTKMATGTTLDLSKVAYQKIVDADMEALKAYLMAKNNKQELNIDKLCVVGAELGASVAALWAQVDWSWPPLATGKQGQDVKALVLISPQYVCKTLKLADALGGHSPVVKELSVLLIVGERNATFLKDTKRIYDILKRYHPEPPPERKQENQDLFLLKLPTDLQGTNLQTVKKPAIDQLIGQFIELRLVKKNIPWRDRSGPK
jgi:alpha-beta hydrolase superfamily lysophospholipase